MGRAQLWLREETCRVDGAAAAAQSQRRERLLRYIPANTRDRVALCSCEPAGREYVKGARINVR